MVNPRNVKNTYQEIFQLVDSRTDKEETIKLLNDLHYSFWYAVVQLEKTQLLGCLVWSLQNVYSEALFEKWLCKNSTSYSADLFLCALAGRREKNQCMSSLLSHRISGRRNRIILQFMQLHQNHQFKAIVYLSKTHHFKTVPFEIRPA